MTVKTSKLTLQQNAFNIAKTIVDISFNASTGHIGSALSISDILTVLYKDIVNPHLIKRKSVNRDYIILSKGHAAAALYSALYHSKIISNKTLFSFGNHKGGICEHPEISTVGVEMTSGSLGYGVGFGSGIALSLKKMNNSTSRVFVIVSDGECNEGSIWEAALFASKHKLDNLTVIVDNNGWQCFGKTQDVSGINPLLPKWQSFGFAGKEIHGHNLSQIKKSLMKRHYAKGKPTIIIANTISGYGVSLFENTLEAHYTTLSSEQYKTAIQDLRIKYKQIT